MKIIDTFQNRLKTAMDLRNIKQVDLVEKTNLDKTLINKYLAGVTNARQKKLTILADALNVNEIWLMGYDVSMERELKLDELGNPVVEVPLLGVVKAGYDYLAQENWIGTVDVDKKLSEGNELFALKIKGDSMSPVLIEDDIVIIKKQDDFETGDIVVALVNGDEATIKKVKKTDNSVILQPLNTNYDPLVFTYDEMKTIPVTIIGVVKQLKREF